MITNIILLIVILGALYLIWKRTNVSRVEEKTKQQEEEARRRLQQFQCDHSASANQHTDKLQKDLEYTPSNNNSSTNTSVSTLTATTTPVTSNSFKVSDQKIDFECITKYDVGNYLTYGSYPQTKEGDDDTPIEWLVLKRDGNKALLISRYALDCKPNDEPGLTSWETCTIRKWLNNDFMNKAFNIAEQSGILMSTVKAEMNLHYDTNPGKDTQDKIFLLSSQEAIELLSDTDRICTPTEYAIAQGTIVRMDNSSTWTAEKYFEFKREWPHAVKCIACWWFLRSPGCHQAYFASVEFNGRVDEDGSHAAFDNSGVRPALWVNLKSGILEYTPSKL